MMPDVEAELLRHYPKEKTMAQIAQECGCNVKAVSRAAHYLERQGRLHLPTQQERVRRACAERVGDRKPSLAQLRHNKWKRERYAALKAQGGRA